MKWIALIILSMNCFEIGYCGHPNSPNTDIQFKKSTKLLLSYLQEEDHQLIHDTLKNKKIQLGSLYFVYRHKKNSSRTDITNYDEKFLRLRQHMKMKPLLIIVI